MNWPIGLGGSVRGGDSGLANRVRGMVLRDWPIGLAAVLGDKLWDILANGVNRQQAKKIANYLSI